MGGKVYPDLSHRPHGERMHAVRRRGPGALDHEVVPAERAEESLCHLRSSGVVRAEEQNPH